MNSVFAAVRSGRTEKSIDKRADTVARTLKALNGCIVQQKAAMGTHTGSSRGDFGDVCSLATIQKRRRCFWWPWWLR